MAPFEDLFIIVELLTKVEKKETNINFFFFLRKGKKKDSRIATWHWAWDSTSVIVKEYHNPGFIVNFV